jgi:hypothetical protein
MLALLLAAQVASQPIILRDPFSPMTETRLSSACGEQRFELRWTVLEGQDSRFDELSANGIVLPSSEIGALNRWKGERSIERISVVCEPHGPSVRTRLLVEFGRAGRLGLPNVGSFEIAGNRVIFEPQSGSRPASGERR